ncbi:MAG: pyridoxal-phosphate dependent enzyme [Proteobacteria bacterium]|nr:MAG: pyridoxal-phosphate dependent enzyme [Pseudomonadota bacterium]
MIHANIIEAIGNTPIVRLNRIGRDVGANVFVKCEFMNPGGSIKDRIGGWMIEDAEKRGVLKPGGTIIESTSGNTGFGLAIAAAIKGYHCIFVLPDKMSEEKIKNLRAFGARVVVTPTAVEPEDPRSYYSVSRRLAEETPNSLYINQYDNLSNRECHYRTTGPEILGQMPDIDAFVAGIGTGGTITGCGRFFRERKPGVEIVAVDPVGSIVYEMFKTGENRTPARSYLIEGIGEDFIPANYDFGVYHDMVQVDDKESFLMTRELLVKEGLFVGMSSGSAVVGALRWIGEQAGRLDGKNVLVVLPDSGNRYLSKVFDDDWMEENGFLEGSAGSVGDLLRFLQKNPGDIVMARQSERISRVVEMMSEAGISQLPVTDDHGWIKGVIREDTLLRAVFRQRASGDESISGLVDTRVEFVSPADSVDRLSRIISDGGVPLVTDRESDGALLAIVTHIDLLNYLGVRR